MSNTPDKAITIINQAARAGGKYAVVTVSDMQGDVTGDCDVVWLAQKLHLLLNDAIGKMTKAERERFAALTEGAATKIN